MTGQGVRLGQFRGIDIGLNYSWVFIFAWVTWMLVSHYFPAHYPGWQASTYWGLAIATSVLFFASILAHELGHSLVALRFGIPVRSITLFIFGGIAQISHEPARAREEFWIAIAGPAVSLLLAGAYWGARSLLGPASPFGALSTWLALINLSLFGFNLIPGFPLDGGRVLRAAIWGATGNLQRATRTASAVGVGVAYTFIAFGLWLSLTVSLWDGLWLGIIGWFLANAAGGSWRQATVHDALAGLVATDALATDTPRVASHVPVSELVDNRVLESAQRSFLVADGETICGIVTLNEIKKIPKGQWAQITVGRIMIPLEQTQPVSPMTPLADVLDRLKSHALNQLPVVSDGNFVGLVSREGIRQRMMIRAEMGI